jgi:hypothetical protein
MKYIGGGDQNAFIQKYKNEETPIPEDIIKKYYHNLFLL